MVISLKNIGCFKNLVDCEKLMWQLQQAGHEVLFDQLPDYADIQVVNTCGFTGDAEEDSIQEIKLFAHRKQQGHVGQLWVMGCYAQKRGASLRRQMPEVDRVYGNFNWHDMLTDIGTTYTQTVARTLTTPPHYAYLKISEGCNQPCSFCIKPVLNGPLASVPMQELVEECRLLVSKGVKEFQLVAQNLTAYGMDTDGQRRLPELVERLADIPGVEWLRLHYAYPIGFPEALLRVMRERDNVCNYLDMAIQHCSPKMLRLMRRAMSKEALVGLIRHIRDEVPGIFLRTTVMTGHPGETEDDFEELCDFVRQQRFERMGVFPFSMQQGSYCEQHYSDDIPEQEKRRRALKLIQIQKEHYQRLNQSLVGTTERIIIDGMRNGHYEGRSEHSTPMADPKVIVETAQPLTVGSFYDVRLTQAVGKDMKGTIIPNDL